MKIGYPCINRSIQCQGDKTFRLASYTPARLFEVVQNNIACLRRMAEYNVQRELFFIRISSSLIPFASHPVCQAPWRRYFEGPLREAGDFLRQHGFRISMHPDQFTLLNAKDPVIVQRSLAELDYHAEVLDMLGMDTTAKIQIHVGGIYGDKPAAIARFVEEYRKLPAKIKRRLVIENDDRLFSLADCLEIHEQTSVPILFDTFHHSLLNAGESLAEAFKAAQETWQKIDGVPMVDYSSQEPGARVGRHTETVDMNDFAKVMGQLKPYDFDVILEIKDKERSAEAALSVLRKAPPAALKPRRS